MKHSFSKSILGVSFLLIALFNSATAHSETVLLDPALPIYTKSQPLKGNLNSIGSDTLNNVMTLWAEAFKAIHPEVTVQVEGKGSSTAPPALIEATAQFGPMSRPMKASEIDAFEKKFGYKPTEIKVAIDALAVFVHKDNPLQSLTLSQIDAIFSSTRKLGGTDITTWKHVNIAGALESTPMSLYGRNSASGTYGFFKEVALENGDFKQTVKEQPGSSSVVLGIANDKSAIGYSGIGYKTDGVKAISLGRTADAVFEPTYENCLSGDYPLSRFLYIYVNKKPDQPLDPLTHEFLKFITSKQGQEIVLKDGYYPLPSSVAAAQQSSL